MAKRDRWSQYEFFDERSEHPLYFRRRRHSMKGASDGEAIQGEPEGSTEVFRPDGHEDEQEERR